MRSQQSQQDFLTDEDYFKYLRFYYAGLAMQGLLSSCVNKVQIDADVLCSDSLKFADSLLKQLKIDSSVE